MDDDVPCTPESKRLRLASISDPKSPIGAKSGITATSTKEAVPVPRFTKGQRVVYTPSTGDSLLAVVRFVGDIGSGKTVCGLEMDGKSILRHDGTHPLTGVRHFKCPEGHGFYVNVDSARLHDASMTDVSEQMEESQRKLLHGLEAMSEDTAQRLSRMQRLAETQLREEQGAENSEQEFRKCWDAREKRYTFFERFHNAARGRPTLPRSGSVSSIEGGPDADFEEDDGDVPRLNHIEDGEVTPAEAASIFNHCLTNWQTPLPCSLLLALVHTARTLILEEPTILRIQRPQNGKLIIIGDTHGHLKDLVHIWKQQGLPSPKTTYLFNGDICDRGDTEKRGGQQAVLIWACVLSFKIAYPDNVFINRGNHEDSTYWVHYGAGGFSREIELKYPRKEADQLIDAFEGLCNSLSLMTIIDGNVVVLHGGLPRHHQSWLRVRLVEIERMRRPLPMPTNMQQRSEQILYDLMWGDPSDQPGIGFNDRGGDIRTFGPDVTRGFLEFWNCQLLIRSHEVPGRQPFYRGRGFEWWHPLDPRDVLKPISASQKGFCLTVFSASEYCGCSCNAGSFVVFFGKPNHFQVFEYQGWQAEQTLLAESSLRLTRLDSTMSSIAEDRCMSQGVLDRGVIEAIVEFKHLLLEQFLAIDKEHLWVLSPSDWQACCYRVLPLIPWEDYLDKSSFVPMQDGKVCYAVFLTRYQCQFRNKLGQHAGFRRRLTDQMFEGLLRADYTLRDTLSAIDTDGDGRISGEEFANALARFGKLLTPAQSKALYRTILTPERTFIRVEDFLAGLSVRFAISHPRTTAAGAEFVPGQIDKICRDILDEEGGPDANESMAVSLRVFFEKADSKEDGHLSSDEFIAAIKTLRSCNGLPQEKLEAIANYVDINGDGHINYAELLLTLCVRHAEGKDETLAEGPKALAEDMLEAVHRILHFEYAKPLKALLRRLLPPGSTRCTPSKFEKGLTVLNGSSGHGLLTTQQIQCLVETLDTDVQVNETEGHFDFEVYFESFRIVDAMAEDAEDEETGKE